VSSGTPFACGSLTCQPGSFCVAGASLYPNDTDISHNCYVAPASCLPTPTCACLTNEIPISSGCSLEGSSCTDDGAGHATISIDDP